MFWSLLVLNPKNDLNLQTKSYISPLLSSIKHIIFLRQNVVIPATQESGIDVGQGINVGPGKFAKKNKRRALNKRRASEFQLIFASI